MAAEEVYLSTEGGRKDEFRLTGKYETNVDDKFMFSYYNTSR